MKFISKFKGVFLFYAVIGFTAYALVLRSNEITHLENMNPMDQRIVVNNN